MDKADIITNRKAFRDYEILERIESGIELAGSEVKSLRQSRVSLDEGFARIEEGQIYLYNLHIPPYAQASYLNVEAKRPRRLLLHSSQIHKLDGKISQKGLTLIPLKMYFNSRGIVKVELALARGKKLYDRRADIKRREIDLQMRKAVKNRSKR